MKSRRLTKYQIAAVANYLLGTELPIYVALHACYIDAEEPGYFASELDSISKSYLEEKIFTCAVCNEWSKMFDHARKTQRIGCTPACERCLMSPKDISNSDSHFLFSCGIGRDLLTVTENPPPSPDIAGTMESNCRLLVTDADLDFLSACGIRVRLSPDDAARRTLVTVRRKNR